MALDQLTLYEARAALTAQASRLLRHLASAEDTIINNTRAMRDVEEQFEFLNEPYPNIASSNRHARDTKTE